jgi:rhomboid protease GluP
MRRTLPTTSNPYYSTGGGYSIPTYSRRTSFGINISRPGRNLIILIVSGLLIGFLSSLFFVDNIQAIIFLLQDNYLVYHGWIPSLVTSMIVATPDLSGLEDVFFNAISVLFVDGLLRNAYRPRQYYLVFLLTGIIGNVLSFLAYGPGTGILPPFTTISFGASGGIFGLLAGALSTDYIVNRRVNTPLLIWFVFVFLISSVGANVDAYAHIGGTISGLVAGYLVGRSRSRSKSYF